MQSNEYLSHDAPSSSFFQLVISQENNTGVLRRGCRLTKLPNLPR